MPTLPCLLLLGAVAAAPAVHAATIMQWVDENGRVHYSDHVPAEAADNAVELAIDPDHNVYAAPPVPHFTPAAPQRRPAHDDAAERRDARERQERAEKCADYQEKFAHLRSRMRAGYRASQYNQLMERERSLQRKIEKYCH